MGFLEHIDQCTPEGQAIWRLIAGMLAVLCLIIAMTMPSDNPLDGTECTIAEIVFASLGAITGLATGASRLLLKQKLCPTCGGTGQRPDAGVVNQTLNIFDQAKNKAARCKRGFLKRYERVKARFTGEEVNFKADRRFHNADGTSTLVDHRRCKTCKGRKYVDISFKAEACNQEVNGKHFVRSSLVLGVGATLLIGLTLIMLFHTPDAAGPGGFFALMTGLSAGGCIFVVLTRHLTTMDVNPFTDMLPDLTPWGITKWGLGKLNPFKRRLMEGDSSGILGLVGTTIASLVAWYVLFREKAKPLPSQRKTIIHRKKRPTFLKNPKPTLGACRRHTCAVTRH